MIYYTSFIVNQPTIIYGVITSAINIVRECRNKDEFGDVLIKLGYDESVVYNVFAVDGYYRSLAVVELKGTFYVLSDSDVRAINSLQYDSKDAFNRKAEELRYSAFRSLLQNARLDVILNPGQNGNC